MTISVTRCSRTGSEMWDAIRILIHSVLITRKTATQFLNLCVLTSSDFQLLVSVFTLISKAAVSGGETGYFFWRGANLNLCWIWCSHSGDYRQNCLLGYNAVYCGGRPPEHTACVMCLLLCWLLPWFTFRP
jgi:hypothetical protein